MAYFESMKCNSGFCFVSCYCYVADNVNKKVGFHGNTPPSRKQRPLIKTSLTIFRFFLLLNFRVKISAFKNCWIDQIEQENKLQLCIVSIN